jgi:hypothetical protein
MILKALLVIAAVITGSALAASSPSAETPVAIVSAEFGIFDASSPKELIFEPTNVVPHKQGQRYGWVIEVKTTKRTLSVREEYLIAKPASPPKSMDPVSENLNIPLQRRNQVSQRQLAPVDGRIFGEWSIGPNEPAGHRHLQVVVEGEVAASFEFDVK